MSEKAPLDRKMADKLTRRSVGLRLMMWPDNGPVSMDAMNRVWRNQCRAAGGDTEECYAASSRADGIVADARRSGRPWKEAAAESISLLPKWEE